MLSLALAAVALEPYGFSAPSTLVDEHEVIVLQTTFQLGSDVPLHYHPGEEVVHIVEGKVTLYREGMAALALGPGDTVSIAPNLHHWATIDEDGTEAMIVRIHPKGEPITVPVAVEGD